MNIKKWVDRCQGLRDRLIKKENNELKLLLANFSGTLQQKDIEKRTVLLQDFFRVKIDVKSWSEEEMQKLGKKAIDFSDNNAVIQSLKNEFDMSWLAFVNKAGRKLQDYNKKFIYQLKGCNLNCQWCYVDDINKNSQEDENSKFFSIPEIFDVFEQERKKQLLYVIRPSGGEPTLVIEQWLECLKESEKRNLDKEVYIQGDTNLTTGHFIEHLEATAQIEKNLLEKIAEYDGLGILCSFKGTDKDSFLEACGFVNKNNEVNERYSFLENERWYTFSKYVEAGIDVYPFVYSPNPDSLVDFLEKGKKLFGGGFPLKTWLFKLKLYGPEKQRLEKLNINTEEYQRRLDDNFNKSLEIMQNFIWKKYGINYAATPRTGIKLRVLKS